MNNSNVSEIIICFQQGLCLREQSLSIGETGAEGNDLGYETIAFAVTGV